ncbi:DUF4123 domain-containing protein [Andreprevotia chitinilytica]|uniref:DUF4123 domain-containing protein n=1 Tax=Andreprevotia chitinilytica TaxID=396808 RepID=UPI0005537301|nr:DUF4123 domain-containing protein [Andreprevotia chitinilytica]
MEHTLLLQHRYLLADFLNWADGPKPDALPSVLCMARGLENDKRILPVLIDIEQLSGAEQQTLCDFEQFQRRNHAAPGVCALLNSAAPIEAIAKYLGNNLMLRASNIEPALFRYYDPRVFAHLMTLLGEEQKATLLGPITHWTARDLTGAWQTTTPTVAGALTGQLFIHASQTAFVRNIGVINRVLKVLKHPPSAQAPDAAEQIHKATETARQYGLAIPDDLVAFASQSQLYGPQIHRHPTVLALLRVTDDELTYAERTESIETDTWQRMAAEAVMTGIAPSRNRLETRAVE